MDETIKESPLWSDDSIIKAQNVAVEHYLNKIVKNMSPVEFRRQYEGVWEINKEGHKE